MNLIVQPELLPVEIYPGLWQGPRPPTGPYLHDRGFKLIVLCEPQFQPKESIFEGPEVIRCPFNDEENLPGMEKIRDVVMQVAPMVVEGRKTMVACHMGVNRSGLVATLIRRFITGESGPEVLKVVDSLKLYTLTNQTFRAFVASLGKRRGMLQKSTTTKAAL